jgi:preprotein translocase subunit SecA
MRQIERSLLPEIFDAVWKEHLVSLDHLRQGMALRAHRRRRAARAGARRLYG